MPIAFRAADGANTGTGTATSIAVNVPAGTVDGDVMVAVVFTTGGTGAEISAPAGWTTVNNTEVGTVLAVATFYRVASSEPASYTFTFDTTSSRQGGAIISSYSGVDNTTPVDVNDVLTESASDANFDCPSVTTTVDDCMLVCTGGWQSTATASWPAGTDERQEQNTSHASVNRSGGVADDLLGAAGPTGTRTVTLSGNGSDKVGTSVALRPAGGAVTATIPPRRTLVGVGI